MSLELLALVWAIILVVQNASFTLVSRARNSASLGFHAAASVVSNGIWFVSQFIIVTSVLDVVKSSDIAKGVFLGCWYVLWTVVGSVLMHYISMRWLEKGKRRVGAS